MTCPAPTIPPAAFSPLSRYAGTLAPGADTTAMFSRLSIPAKLTESDVTTRISQNGAFHIDVVSCPGHPDQRLCQLGRGLCRL